jgi:hypothetical protein
MRLLLAALLAAGAPAAHHTASGAKAARATLLTQKDVGKSWSAAAPAAQQGVALTCPFHTPSGKGIVEVGVASSPAFSPAPTGPFIQQNTSVYASAAQAATWWRRAVTPSLARCASETLAALGARGVKVGAAARRKLAIRTVLPHTASYRVTATANGKKLYFDLIVLGSGRTITALTITSFVQPVPARDEQALAALIVRKLGGPSA